MIEEKVKQWANDLEGVNKWLEEHLEEHKRLEAWAQGAYHLLYEMYTTRQTNLNDIAVGLSTAPAIVKKHVV